jgi:hypothetical protein
MTGVLAGLVGSMKGAVAFSATGGTTTDSGGYRYHTFNASGNFVVTGSKSMDILVVGGGGGGGGASGDKFNNYAGPGGGAGVFATATRTISTGTHPVTVGAGGAGGSGPGGGQLGEKGIPSLLKLTDTSSYAIGDTGPAGGKVFITPSTSGNGTGLYFEVAPVASEVSRTWAQSSLQSTLVAGAKFFEIGTGSIITPKIVAQGNSSDTTCAATYCDNYTYGGYSDWFLPSQSEMIALYTNRVAVNSSISTTSSYWTSSEDILQVSGIPNGRVWIIGVSSTVATKNSSYLVRPVRAFAASAFTPIYAVGGTITTSSSQTSAGHSVFEGGIEYSADFPTSGGGGGTSAVGQAAYYTSPNYYSGNGGAGSTWNSFKSFGGGGGAGGYYVTGYYTINNRGIGGTTGGGAGSDASIATPIDGTAGTTNTGGGGGGGSFKDYNTTSGGNGGSGVVIVRYLL